MKRIIWSLFGFIVASFAFFAVVYVLGLTAESAGVSLYDSEADQQRNFNIVMLLWLLLGVLVVALAAWKMTAGEQQGKKR